jgi:hypothetical protein
MTWTATSGLAIAAGDAKAQLAAAYHAPAGTFTWHSGWPWMLRQQWTAGSGNILNVGAIRAFESVHGMTMDGIAGNAVWSRLFTALAKGQANPNGYTYAIANQHYPISLTVWHDGKVVLESAANTGIPQSPTVDGTFPVYLKYYFSYMKGTNPDGTKYNDPVYYASYFNGRRGAPVQPVQLRVLPEPGLRGAALRRGQEGVPVPDLRQPGHGDRTGGLRPWLTAQNGAALDGPPRSARFVSC